MAASTLTQRGTRWACAATSHLTPRPLAGHPGLPPRQPSPAGAGLTPPTHIAACAPRCMPEKPALSPQQMPATPHLTPRSLTENPAPHSSAEVVPLAHRFHVEHGFCCLTETQGLPALLDWATPRTVSHGPARGAGMWGGRRKPNASPLGQSRRTRRTSRPPHVTDGTSSQRRQEAWRGFMWNDCRVGRRAHS